MSNENICNADISEVKRAVISGASTNNTLVSAVSGKRIRVLQFAIICTSAVSVTFQSSTTSDLTGAMPFAANGGIEASHNPVGHFQSVAGELLNMKLSSGVQVSGWLTYQEIG